MNKSEYFKNLEEIVVDTLFIGDSVDDMEQKYHTTLGQFLLVTN